MKNDKKKMQNFLRPSGFACLLITLCGLYAPARAYTPPVTQEGIFTVTVHEAEDALARALEKEGAADIVQTHITSTRLNVLYRYGKAIGVDVKTLKFDDGERNFSANLYFTNGDDVLSVLPVSGRFEEMISLPVARERITHGETIAREDLDEILYPVDKMRKNTAVSARQIVGKSPLRSIAPGRPIRLSELQAPAVLEKGAKVQMRYRTPYLVISTLGEALEDGAQGENIRVRNYESGTIVKAEVASGSEVYVGSTPFRVE